MINIISKIKNLFEPEVITNEPTEMILEADESTIRKKVTFRVDAFMSKNIEELISHTDLSISIFVKTALYDYISFYKELNSEPFQIGHWLDDTELDLSFAKYTITLDDTLSNELRRLESVYNTKSLIFNKSHFVRCAIINRLHNLMIENTES